MNVQVVVAILLIAVVPVYAQAQSPSVPIVSKDDAEKVVRLISCDQAKIQPIAKTLGPEYAASIDRLVGIDPEKDKLAFEILSVFGEIKRLCTR